MTKQTLSKQQIDAEQLGAAADKLRQLATTAQTDLETANYWKPYASNAWAHGFINGFGGPSSDYAAVLPPAVGLALSDWLGCLAMLDPSERGGDACGWCGDNHALIVARAIHTPAPAAPAGDGQQQ